MKIRYPFLTFFKIILVVGMSYFPLTCLAKEIGLYDQPKADAKIIDKIDLADGFILIYTPKEGGWIKIADPKNGNVGWIKSNELNNENSTQASFTFTQSYTKDNNKSPMTYRIIQFGPPSKLSTEQEQAIRKKIQMQQQALQESVQGMMHNMDQLFYDNWHFTPGNFPFLMPVIILPVQDATNVKLQNATPNKQAAPASSSTSPSNQKQSNTPKK